MKAGRREVLTEAVDRLVGAAESLGAVPIEAFAHAGLRGAPN